MTTTSGLAPVAAAKEAAVGLLDTLAGPASQRRPRLGLMVVGLDTMVGFAVAFAVVVAAPAAGSGAQASAALVAGWPLAVAVTGGYGRLATDALRLPARALLAAALVTATAAWSTPALVSAATGPSPRALAERALLAAAALLGLSAVVRGLVALAVPARPLATVLVGSSSQVRELLREAARHRGGRAFEPVAACLPDPDRDDLEPASESWTVPVWRYTQDSLVDVVRRHEAGAVVVAPGPEITHAELRRWAAWLQHEDVQLLVSTGLRDVAAGRIDLSALGGSRLVAVSPAPLGGPMRLLKDVADRVGSLVLLLGLTPLFAVLALLIRADSDGPAFYRQTRVGRNGRLFTVYKLRTMVTDADRDRHELATDNESDPSGVLFKIHCDPRLTRLGSFLRRSSLDELPQLLNVLRGDMSLVGPRPALPSEVAAYEPDMRRRLDVKPGLTGLWQVSGRSDLSWEDTVRLDLQYVDNWCWSLDLSIAARTVGAVLARRGAY